MHFEFLVEGQVEVATLSVLLPMALGTYKVDHTWKIHKHRGVGKLPEDILSSPRASDRSLLHNLPSKLRAYGRDAHEGLVVVVLVDLDDRDDCADFKKQLVAVHNSCNPKPETVICIAIEELESWFLGDEAALHAVFPNVILRVLSGYKQDSQCGTWEILADAVYPGGIRALIDNCGKRSVRILEQKRVWASKIAPKMDISKNKSPSFNYFIKKITAYNLK